MAAWFQRLRRPPVVAGATVLVVFACVLSVREMGAFEALELGLFDRFLTMRSARDLGPSRVVLVTVGDDEFGEFGYPLPDAVMARSLERLMEYGASTVGVDIYREPPYGSDPEAWQGWRELGQTVLADPRIIMIRRLESVAGEEFPRPDFLKDDEQVGFVDLVVDSGSVARRALIMSWDENDQAAFSISLQMAFVHGVPIQQDLDNEEHLLIGETPVPPLEADDGGYRGVDDLGYQFLLDYARAAQSFPSYSLSALLDGQIPRSAFDGHAVLMGIDSPTVKDNFRAPYGSGDEIGAIKGMVIHAYILDQLLRMGLDGDRPIRFARERVEVAWIALWSLLGAATALWLVRLAWLVGVVMLGVGVLGASSFGLLQLGIWFPMVSALAAWVATSGLVIAYVSARQRAERRTVMGFFRRFASRTVADELWRRRQDFMDGGRPRPQRLVATALLSDLKGYTAAAEKMDPAELMDWINSYMNAMTQVIEAHRGHVDDYVGDGIKANFGVPLPSEGEEEVAADARRAVACALAMADELERLNGRWQEQGLPTGRQRIGLCTGPVVVGSLGSDERLKYTSVGDTVNTSARLEGFSAPGFDFDAEEALFRILVTESTWRRLDDSFQSECIGEHRLKGRAESVRIYRIYGGGPSGESSG